MLSSIADIRIIAPSMARAAGGVEPAPQADAGVVAIDGAAAVHSPPARSGDGKTSQPERGPSQSGAEAATTPGSETPTGVILSTVGPPRPRARVAQVGKDGWLSPRGASPGVLSGVQCA
jgi:hypothetical protein